jgi:probable HAF family extracellular repeat protein
MVWQNDGKPMLDISGGNFLGDACCINASGQVAGEDTYSTGEAFLWRNDGTPPQFLGKLGGAYTYSIALNDSGQVAGFSDTQGTLKPHAFVWLNDGTPMHDLGTFGGTHSESNDINAAGQVIGFANLTGDKIAHAFTWKNDGTKIQDLNALIDPTDPLKPYVTLTSGDYINARSDILAEGTDSRTGQAGLYLLQGTGLTNSVLTLSPRSLAFGNLPIHTSSAAQSVTVTNTSPNTVAITSIALRGTAPGQFAFTDNCGKSLAGHAHCTFEATFRPTSKGPKTAFLDVNGGGGGLRSVRLTGMGT